MTACLLVYDTHVKQEENKEYALFPKAFRERSLKALAFNWIRCLLERLVEGLP